MATAEALARKARRRNRRKLMIEAVIVLGLTAIGALIIFLVYRHPIGSPWKVAGTNVQDISRAQGSQTEIASALDPSNCAWGDPSVAIAPSGREYGAFTEKSICIEGPDLTPYLVVASRPGPKGPWTVRRLTHPAVKYGFDDKPAVTVAGDGRAVVAWSRLLGRAYQTTVYSTSTDGGRTWTPPRVLDRKLVQPQLVTLAAGPAHSVYIAGVDASGLWVGRSTDGGRHFGLHKGVVALPGSTARTCIVFGKFVLPQQAVRCLGPNPTLPIGKGRVFLPYGVNGTDMTRDVAVAVFDPALRLVSRGPIAPGKKKADQFWPTSTFDVKTGKLWACFYDTTGDPARQHAWFVYSSSKDGRRWTTPVRAASPSENPDTLWEDARIFGYGDNGGYGGDPARTAQPRGGHPPLG